MARSCAFVNRFVAAVIVAVGTFAASAGWDAGLSRAYAADEAKPAANEIVYGNPDAPVTIVEYASLTCPHCANFHTEMMPLLKERLLDTGKAKLIFKDFPLDQLALRAAVMVRCNTGTRSRASPIMSPRRITTKSEPPSGLRRRLLAVSCAVLGDTP